MLSLNVLDKLSEFIRIFNCVGFVAHEGEWNRPRGCSSNSHRLVDVSPHHTFEDANHVLIVFSLFLFSLERARPMDELLLFFLHRPHKGEGEFLPPPPGGVLG